MDAIALDAIAVIDSLYTSIARLMSNSASLSKQLFNQNIMFKIDKRYKKSQVFVAQIIIIYVRTGFTPTLKSSGKKT